MVGSMLSFLGVQPVIWVCFPSDLFLQRGKDYGDRIENWEHSSRVSSNEGLMRFPGRIYIKTLALSMGPYVYAMSFLVHSERLIMVIGECLYQCLAALTLPYILN